MATEYEGEVLDIDPDRVAEAITRLGGRRTGEFLLRRHVYDIVPRRHIDVVAVAG